MAFLPPIPPELRDAYQDEERKKTIEKTQWGCIFGIVLVPVFGLLDFIFFSDLPARQVWMFFVIRVLCSCLMAGLYYLLKKPSWVTDHYHYAGLALLFLPSLTISLIIFMTTGAESQYYAGLTLVLMVLAVVLDWPFMQSLASVGLVLLLYVSACVAASFFFKTPFDQRLFISNLFFLISCSIAIIAGTLFHSRVRIREFIARRELDESNRKLATSLQQLEENKMKLVRSEKMASLGKMSAGIIHEINNPLNFATTNLYALRKKSRHLAPEQQADYTEILTDAEDGLKRVQTIVSNLRMFTHPSTEQLDQVPVAGVVTQALRFLSKDTVKVQQDLPEHQTVRVNKDKLIQVLENLFKNSLDALKTKAFPAGETPTILIAGRLVNGHSILSVRDNGSGIDPKHLDKIFDPFFTTKDVGAGMGLGLFMCNSIVEEYGGKISVQSEPGKFCEFTLEFPAPTHQPDNGR